MSEERRKPTPLGELIESYIRAKEAEVLEPRQRIEAAWARIVSAGLAPGTRVGGYRDGVLTVEVRSPPVFAELSQFGRRRLLDRLLEDVGGDAPIKDLKFRLGSW